MISIESCNNGLRFFGEVEILCEILSRLPLKPLVRFKSVCRDWKWLIEQDLNFINLHLTHSKSTINRMCLLVYPLHDTVRPERMVLFSAEEEGVLFSGKSSLLSCRNVIDTDFSIPAGVEMLKPVNGLVCFHNHRSGSVLIYNPSTRERSSWIKTNTEKQREEYVRLRRESKPNESEIRTSSCGFGFDPITRQHKVICVNKISKIRTDPAAVRSCVKEIICEVLTVGENKWRKLGKVPLIRVNRSAYANGYIYWMNYEKSSFNQPEVIWGFDVGSEKFNRVIKIPKTMLDLWLLKRNRVSTTLVYELVQVDGHIAIIDREGDCWINLWIYNDDTGNSNGNACYGNWIKETIPLPCVWDGRGYLAFEHIPGTDIIIIKGFHKPIELECIYYYSRGKKEYYSKQVEFITTTNNTSSNYTRHPDRGYQIASFFQTLVPVQVKSKEST